VEKEAKDNFTVSELVKYYNEFVLKQNKIDDELKAFEKLIPENVDSLSQTEKNDLISKLEEIHNSIKDMKEDFKINAQFLVTYDKQNYMEILEKTTKYHNDLKEKLNPRKKFVFSLKSSQQQTNNFKREIVNVTFPKESSTEEQIEKNNNEDISKTINSTNENDLVVKNKTKEKIILREAEFKGKNNLILENIQDCEIYILFNFKACYVKNLTDTKIFLGSINGGTHINDCTNCSFYLATHQLRIHRTHHTTFSIIVSSNPIIEDCSNLVFSPLNVKYNDLDQNLTSASLTKERNKWNAVLDFKWHKKEKSPNFEYIDQESLNLAPIEIEI